MKNYFAEMTVGGLAAALLIYSVSLTLAFGALALYAFGGGGCK